MNAQELQTRLKSFSYRIVNLSRVLPKELVSEIIIKQILRLHFLLLQIIELLVELNLKKHLFQNLALL